MKFLDYAYCVKTFNKLNILCTELLRHMKLMRKIIFFWKTVLFFNEKPLYFLNFHSFLFFLLKFFDSKTKIICILVWKFKRQESFFLPKILWEDIKFTVVKSCRIQQTIVMVALTVDACWLRTCIVWKCILIF